MSVDLDFADSATTPPGPAVGDDVGVVEVSLTPEPPCTAGQLDVTTLVQLFDDATGDHDGNDFADQAFMFIVP